MAKTHLTFVIFSILISIVVILTYTGYTLKKDVNEALKKDVNEKTAKDYQEILLEQTRRDLEDYVDIAYSAMDALYKEHYGQPLKEIMEKATEEIVNKQKQVGNKEIHIAKEKAIEKIKSLIKKSDDEKKDIWISNTTYPIPQIIMHSKIPHLKGSIPDKKDNDKKYDCVRGRNIWAVALEIVTQPTTNRHEGFFYYPWDDAKKDCLAPNVIKLVYVKSFPQWKWIIGTGILINDAEEKLKNEIKKQIKKQIGAMRYDNSKGYFGLYDINESSHQYVMHPDPKREKKSLDEKKKSLDEKKFSKYKTILKDCVNLDEKELNECKTVPKCVCNEGGYVDYETDTIYDGEKFSQIKNVSKPKKVSSYIRLYEPLDWIIGTGTYIDDIEEAAALKQLEINQEINYLLTDIIIVTILIILFLAIMSHLVNRYFFPKAKSKFTSMMDKAIANEKKNDYKQSGTAISPASTAELNKIVRKHVWLAMAVGLIPIPLFNFVSVTAVQISMLSDIASKFGVTSSSEKVKTLLTSLVGGAIPLATSGYMARIIRAIPIVNHTVGFVTMPMVSGASTYAVGKIFILHFSKGGTFSTFKEEDAKKDYVRIVNEEQKSIG